MKLVCAGEVMTEFAPAGDPGLYQRAFAGDSFNTAVYLARAGLNTRYLTRLGDDAGSDGALRLMQDEGIDCTLVARDPGCRIGLYIIDNAADGERTFTYYRDASPARRLFDVPVEFNATLFYFTGITLAVARSGQAHLLTLLESLRSMDCQIVFDPNHRPGLWADVSEARASHSAVLPYCNMVLPTQSDDAALWGCHTARDSIDFYRRQGATEVVVKGEDLLAEVWRTDGCARRRAEPVAALDTTGAGDAFNAGYLASRLRGGDLEVSLIAAQTLAAQVVAHRGAIVPRGEAYVPRGEGQ